MAFRTSEYLQRNELVRYQLNNVIDDMPGNNQHQSKTGYKFTTTDRSTLYDWYNAYFEVQFQVQLLADGTTTGAARISVINGATSLINHIKIKSAGKIVYDTDNVHKVTFVKNLLECSDDFSRSVAKNTFWYLDTADSVVDGENTGFDARMALTTGLKNVNVIIPLNRYGFFEELYERILPAMQLEFSIELQNDNELIYKAAAGGASRVVVNRFLLWIPKIIPKDSIYEKFVDSFMKSRTWDYGKEMYTVSGPRNNSGFYMISPSADRVKAVFVYLQRYKTDNANENPYLFDTFKLQAADNDGNVDRYLTCSLEYGNGIFYPETEYDSESKARIFNDLMAYGMRKNNYNSGTQLNMSNYNSLYPLIFFDLSFQTEKVTRDPKQLIFRYKINADTQQADAFSVHAIIIYDQTVVIKKMGDELVIV